MTARKTKAAPTPPPAAAEPPPARKSRKLLIAVGALALLGGGVGAGLYAAKAFIPADPAAVPDDPNRPKLVERGDDIAEPAAEGSEEPAPRVGTVSVANDRVPVDPRRFAVAYVNLEQPLTANLADGSGFVQLGLSIATYYDDRVVANIKRQTVPIRSAALMVLSEQDPAVIATPSGKQALQRQLTGAINHVLRETEGFGGVDNVYFTSLVVQ